MQIGEGFLKERYVPMQAFREEHRKSIENLEEFWAEGAKVIDWFKTWEEVLDDSKAPFFRCSLEELSTQATTPLTDT